MAVEDQQMKQRPHDDAHEHIRAGAGPPFAVFFGVKLHAEAIEQEDGQHKRSPNQGDRQAGEEPDVAAGLIQSRTNIHRQEPQYPGGKRGRRHGDQRLTKEVPNKTGPALTPFMPRCRRPMA